MKNCDLFIGKGAAPVLKEHHCHFIIKLGGNARRCGLTFSSKNKLAAHKQQANHMQRKRKSGDSSKGVTSAPKQLRLEDTLILANVSVQNPVGPIFY